MVRGKRPTRRWWSWELNEDPLEDHTKPVWGAEGSREPECWVSLPFSSNSQNFQNAAFGHCVGSARATVAGKVTLGQAGGRGGPTWVGWSAGPGRPASGSQPMPGAISPTVPCRDWGRAAPSWLAGSWWAP